MPPKLPPLPLPRLVTKKLMLLGAPEPLAPLAPLPPAEPAAPDPPAPVLALPPEPAVCSLSVVLSESLSEQALVAINKRLKWNAKRPKYTGTSQWPDAGN